MSDLLAPTGIHPTQQRPIYPALDAVRFLAAVLVMVYHLIFFHNGDIPDASHTVARFWRFGWVGVEIFFCLSGLVIAYSAEQAAAASFLVNRIVRLAPTIWICATVTLIAVVTLWHPADLRQLLTDYLWTVILRPAGRHIDPVYWTLTVEISFYAVVCFMLWWSTFRMLLRVMVIIGAISVAFNSILALSPELHEWLPGATSLAIEASRSHTSRLLLLRHGCFFALGMLIWSLKNKSRPKYCIALVAFCAGGGTMEVWYEAQTQLTNTPALHYSPLLPVLAWLAGLSMIFLSRLAPPAHLRGGIDGVSVLRYLGLLTFPLYLIHNNVGLAFENALSMHGSAAATLAAGCAVVLLSILVTSFVEPPFARSFKALLKRMVLKAAPLPLPPVH